jgi:predicted DNA-binding antitoxin AbrB/MazE fold protein
MPKTIHAIYKNGVLKPTRKLPFKEAQKVVLKVVKAEPSVRAGADRVALLHRLVTYRGSGCGDLASRSKEYLRKLSHERRRSRTG